MWRTVRRAPDVWAYIGVAALLAISRVARFVRDLFPSVHSSYGNAGARGGLVAAATETR